MSNAMSITKSRWKGALLATVAAASASVLTPLAAHAQSTPGSMSLSLSLAPMKDVINSGAFGSTEYIAPDAGTVPVYVYATVTQQNNITSVNNAGLEFAYFNVLQNYSTDPNYNLTGVNSTGINNSDGSIVSATTSPLFSAYGSQNGSTNFTSGYYAVGSGISIGAQNASLSGTAAASSLSLMAKARSASPIWSNGLNVSNGISYTNFNDGTNVYISGNTISFLVETLQYQPSWLGNPKAWNDPTLGENTLTVTVPNLPAGSGYVGANYFTGNPTGMNGSAGSNYTNYNSVGTSYTHTAYAANGATVGGYAFSQTVGLYDAAIGDVFLQGYVDSPSLGTVVHDYLNGGSGWTNGDFFGDGFVASYDLGNTVSAYLAGANYGPYAAGTGPSVVFGPAAQIGAGSAVPEPGSLALLSVAGLSLMRRRSKAKQA